ncbi:MAG: phage tail protein [Flavobacteriales bacterium]|nr:phage tail protein [Flavobacteriales bacterium]
MATDAQAAIITDYPISAFRYSATIGGTAISFSEISGLNMDYDTTEYKEAAAGGVRTIQVAGQRQAPSLTLKRGLFKDGLELYEWFNSIHTGKFTKKEVVISLLDNENKSIMTWKVMNAFPTKFEGPSLDAKSNEVSFQSIEIKGDSIEVSN